MSISPTTSRPTAGGDLVPTGVWRISEESLIEFSVRSLGRTVRGRFGAFRGRLVHREGEGVIASGAVDVASLDTGGADRDRHLRSADFLDAARYPQITFGSRRILARGHSYDIPGTLRIKDVSRDLSLIGRRLPPALRDDADTVRIAARATIDRHTFAIKPPARVELFGLGVGDHVKLELLVVAVLEAPRAGD